MEKSFYPTLYWAGDYLLLRLKLIHVRRSNDGLSVTNVVLKEACNIAQFQSTRRHHELRAYFMG